MSELLSGERQVAADLEEIRADHTARYQWATAFGLEGRSVLDAGCGVGYGAAMLADAGAASVFAVDNSGEALEYGAEHWSRPTIQWGWGELENLAGDGVDVVVAFEVLEHLAHPERFLTSSMVASSAELLVSVPNEDGFPYRGYKFHHRHYTKSELTELLRSTGWEVVSWGAQEGPTSAVVDQPGPELVKSARTLVARCRRKGGKTVLVPGPSGELHRGPEAVLPTEVIPSDIPSWMRCEAESVAIVAMGRSCGDWLRMCASKGGTPNVVDEVWAINAMGGIIQHDRLFHMDDVRMNQRRVQAMARGEYRRNEPLWGTMTWLAQHPGPIYTSRPHPDYPGTVAMPVQEVIDAARSTYLNSTVAWALGFALLMLERWGKLRELHLYGMDFSYANSHKAERGRGCVENLLGKLTERGVHLHLPNSTSLMDADQPLPVRLYGFDTERISVTADEGGRPVFHREPLPEDQWPTALELEQRYRPGSDFTPPKRPPRNLVSEAHTVDIPTPTGDSGE